MSARANGYVPLFKSAGWLFYSDWTGVCIAIAVLVLAVIHQASHWFSELLDVEMRFLLGSVSSNGGVVSWVREIKRSGSHQACVVSPAQIGLQFLFHCFSLGRHCVVAQWCCNLFIIAGLCVSCRAKQQSRANAKFRMLVEPKKWRTWTFLHQSKWFLHSANGSQTWELVELCSEPRELKELCLLLLTVRDADVLHGWQPPRIDTQNTPKLFALDMTGSIFTCLGNIFMYFLVVISGTFL